MRYRGHDGLAAYRPGGCGVYQFEGGLLTELGGQMRRFLRAANGWQRIWIAVSALVFIWMVVVAPYSQWRGTTDGRDHFYRALQRDFETPACSTFISAPFKELSEPPYNDTGGSCWYIYTDRHYNENPDKPANLREYDRGRRLNELKTYSMFLGFYVALYVALVAILYGLGTVIAWIRRGFHTKISETDAPL